MTTTRPEASVDSTRYDALLARLTELESVLVAYSGGVDSTLLAYAAKQALGSRTRAVLAVSEVEPSGEAAAAREVAVAIGLELVEVRATELEDPRFVANPPERCYYCKLGLFETLRTVAAEYGLAHVADGSNADDLTDFRPGSRAAAEHGVVRPLQEIGMTKAEIRRVARDLGLPNWDKPSMACLASRFPYGSAIEADALARVSRAEEVVRSLGFEQFRVRSHGDLARLEVAPADLARAFEMRGALAEALRAAGFAWSALDLEGYRSGSMNSALSPDERD